MSDTRLGLRGSSWLSALPTEESRGSNLWPRDSSPEAGRLEGNQRCFPTHEEIGNSNLWFPISYGPGGSKWLSAPPTGSSWLSALPTGSKCVQAQPALPTLGGKMCALFAESDKKEGAALRRA